MTSAGDILYTAAKRDKSRYMCKGSVTAQFVVVVLLLSDTIVVHFELKESEFYAVDSTDNTRTKRTNQYTTRELGIYLFPTSGGSAR